MHQTDFSRLTSQQLLDHAVAQAAALLPEGFCLKALRSPLFHPDALAAVTAYSGTCKPVLLPDADARPAALVALHAHLPLHTDHVPQGFDAGAYRLFGAYHAIASERFDMIKTRIFEAIGARSSAYQAYIAANVADRFAALMTLRDTGGMATVNTIAHQRLAAVVNGVDLGPEETFIPPKATTGYTTPTLRDAMMCPPAQLEKLTAQKVFDDHVLGHFFVKGADDTDLALCSECGLLSGDEFALFDRDVRHPNAPIAHDMTTLYYMKSHPLLTGTDAPANAVEKHLFRERVEAHLINNHSGYNDLCYRTAYLESTRRIQQLGGMDEFVVLGTGLTQAERDAVLDDMLAFYYTARAPYEANEAAAPPVAVARPRR
jgi:hypothetical protein